MGRPLTGKTAPTGRTSLIERFGGKVSEPAVKPAAKETSKPTAVKKTVAPAKKAAAPVKKESPVKKSGPIVKSFGDKQRDKEALRKADIERRNKALAKNKK
jgi:hypothetical protein